MRFLQLEHDMTYLKTNQFILRRKRCFSILGSLAQFALVIAILLDRSHITNIDFLIGMLYGFSMVGNLAFLIIVQPYRGEFK